MGRIEAQRQGAKVLVTGTHSTGKTTFVRALAAKIGSSNVDVLAEAARDCPFALNLKQNVLSTSWLLAAQIKAEIERQTRPGVRVVLCDRGLPDVLAYHEVFAGTVSRWMNDLAAEWLSSYDLVLVAQPNPSQPIAPDPLRPEDEGFRADVQRAIEQRLAACGVTYELLPHDLVARVARELPRSWLSGGS